MKTECVQVKGEVTKILPSGFYLIVLKKVNVEVLAYLSGKMTKHKIRPEVGDEVVLEMSPTDVKRGRIVKRM
jgi:translation initiation factor IF-1